MPAYMRNYTKRIFLFMASYVLILFGGLSFARGGSDPSDSILVVLALLTAFPICGVFWTIYRLLVECEDEYQRQLFIKQTLLATALALSIATIWEFLMVYDVVESGPQWVAVIWFAMLGLAAPIVRLRA